MYFDSVGAALAMDGHGGYVWAAYLITAVVLTALLVLPRRRVKRFRKQLAGEIRRQRSATGKSEEE